MLKVDRPVLFLKATIKHQILVPAYTKADGTVVAAHHKMVNIDPDKTLHDVISGNGSFSQKEAHKKLSKHPDWHKLSPEDQHAHILSSAQNIQTKASEAAKVSMFKKQMLAGQTPSKANTDAFLDLIHDTPIKAAKLKNEIVAVVGIEKWNAIWGIETLEPAKQVPQINWDSYKLDPSKNTNASSHNKKVAAIKAAHDAGDIAALEAMKFGSNTYGKKQAKLAEVAIAHIKEYGGDAPAPQAASAAPKQDKPASAAPPHFGQLHQDQVLQAKGESATFKFDGTDWLWSTSGGKWNKINTATFIEKLNNGKSSSGNSLAVVPTPGSFGKDNPNKVFYSDGMSFKFDAAQGAWKAKYSGSKHEYPVDNDEWISALNNGKTPNGESLIASDDVSPVPDSSMWESSDSDPAFGYGPTMYSVGHYIAYSSEDGEWEVGPNNPANPDEMEANTKHYAAPERVQTYLQSIGVNPPELADIQKMSKVSASSSPVSPPPASPTVSAGTETWKLVNTSPGHNKFWTIEMDPVKKTVTKSWGKIGTVGQSKTYNFGSAVAAEKAMKEWKDGKLKGGYSVDEMFLATGGIDDPQAAGEAAAAADQTMKDFGAKNAGKKFVNPNSGNLNMFLNGKWWYKAPGEQSWGMVTNQHAIAAYNAGVDLSGNPLVAREKSNGSDGDIKMGADGLLILKDGHWHKMSAVDVVAQIPFPLLDGGFPIFSQKLLSIVASVSTGGSAALKNIKMVKSSQLGKSRLNITVKPVTGLAEKISGFVEKDGKKWVTVHSPASIQSKNVALIANYVDAVKEAVGLHEKGKQAALFGLLNSIETPPSKASQTPSVDLSASPKLHVVSSVKVGTVGDQGESIDGWEKVGEQGGYNPGGTYKDADGVDWYCKFPAGGAKVVRNELLANKLYEAANVSVPDVKLVTKNGKIGIASKIVHGAVKDKSALLAGKSDGLLSGFIADAWLANWDVVGNNPASGKGWDNIMFKDGKAYRIDPGGSLLFGGAGGAKTNFGNDVTDIDTMRDANINARTAAVFGKMSSADLNASAQKVLAISDEQITAMVNQFGPGDSAMKADLAAKLIARKSYIAAKFPKAASKASAAPTKVKLPPKKKVDLNDTSWVKLKPGEEIVESGEKFGVVFAKIKVPAIGFNKAGIPKPPEYTYSSKPHVNAANTADLKRIYDLAISGATPQQIKNIQFEEISKETGEKTGKMLSIEQHPSTKYLLEYHSQVIAEVKAQMEPTYRVEHSGSFAESYSHAAKSIASRVKKVAHENFKGWKDRAADYLVLDRSVGEAIPAPEAGSFKDVESLNSPLIKKWADASRKEIDSLPAIQRSALKSYTGSSYVSWNTAMRLGEMDSSGWSGSQNLRNAFDKAAIPLPEGIILHRGVGVGQQTFKSVVGAVIQDGSFQSTSYGSKAAFSSQSSQLRLHITAGVKAVLAAHVSSHGEREILLDRNCRYLVMGVDGKNVDILVLPHEE